MGNRNQLDGLRVLCGESIRAGHHVALLFGLLFLSSGLAAQQRDLILATTTSVRDAGLLEYLLPRFERHSRRRVKVIAVGSGQAMELGRRGEADILIVHDPGAEVEFMAQGHGSERFPMAHNEFAIVGPRGDPAGIGGMTSAVAAFQAIARSRPRFVSRGDRSGTQAKELLLWGLAGVGLAAKTDPWYIESGQGMGATLQIANELEAYTLTDIATLLTHASPLELGILVKGDTLLRNPYHIILIDARRFSWVDAAGAAQLKDYLLSPETQAAIAAYKREQFGRSIFVPDAVTCCEK
ncbi:MAG: substrate-binding domain-containing protein [Gemmatimonadetes bacterium]|nr:substrate-binding domain-containing protein [Gemmatimonadota bacterium]